MEITIKIDDREVERIFKELLEKWNCEKIGNIYSRFFGKGCNLYVGDFETDMLFLKHVQANANSLLKKRGCVFLNEIYDMLGMPIDEDGQIVGWIFSDSNRVGDNYIDFGLKDNFYNRHKEGILLVFNVDGSIIDRLNEIAP